jgi:hypothetical protein
MEPLRKAELLSPVALKARELELEEQLLSRPQAQAQRIHCELIKELQRNAPWLLPMVLK